MHPGNGRSVPRPTAREALVSWVSLMVTASGIETRHLLALRQIVRDGSFGEAAMSLGYTQSAISQQIASLERAVGERLIERPRGRGRVWLTEAGEVVLRHAEAVFAEVHGLAESLDALRRGVARLRVGTYQSVSTQILPPVVRAFRAAHPDTALELAEATDDDVIFAMLQRAELDLSFALLPAPSGPFEAVELLRDPYVLVVAADSSLADRCDPISVQELSQLPLIGFKNCRQERWLQSHIESQGLAPRWVFRSDDNSTIQAMAAAGVGCAVVPRLTVNATHQGTVSIDLGGSVPPRRLGVVWRADRGLNELAEEFVDLARGATDMFRRSRLVRDDR